jgi:hypothetical protein
MGVPSRTLVFPDGPPDAPLQHFAFTQAAAERILEELS